MAVGSCLLIEGNAELLEGLQNGRVHLIQRVQLLFEFWRAVVPQRLVVNTLIPANQDASFL